jgi:hypothetical protein
VYHILIGKNADVQHASSGNNEATTKQQHKHLTTSNTGRTVTWLWYPNNTYSRIQSLAPTCGIEEPILQLLEIYSLELVFHIPIEATGTSSYSLPTRVRETKRTRTMLGREHIVCPYMLSRDVHLPVKVRVSSLDLSDALASISTHSRRHSRTSDYTPAEFVVSLQLCSRHGPLHSDPQRTRIACCNGTGGNGSSGRNRSNSSGMCVCHCALPLFV